ncbi:MAG TPA: ribbon-helix-helix domain-containing protein [Tepidiformaceae bacterium]|nr:ribbon-helix-helix domain-containing protein [Tepidiformaceae bacterium]
MRTTITVEPEVFETLRRIAFERRISLAALIREAMAEKASERRPRPQSLGTGYSAEPDIAERMADDEFEPDRWR